MCSIQLGKRHPAKCPRKLRESCLLKEKKGGKRQRGRAGELNQRCALLLLSNNEDSKSQQHETTVSDRTG